MVYLMPNRTTKKIRQAYLYQGWIAGQEEGNEYCQSIMVAVRGVQNTSFPHVGARMVYHGRLNAGGPWWQALPSSWWIGESSDADS